MVMELTQGQYLGTWNWDENHIKMFPLGWIKQVCIVLKTLVKGTPARYYILTILFEGREKLTDAYDDAPAIIDQYAENKFF
jgi:hypothetical protein